MNDQYSKFSFTADMKGFLMEDHGGRADYMER